MISILIPTYNYNAYPLAKELVKRAQKAELVFELICIDDGSKSKLNIENKKINNLSHSLFIENNSNIGRAAIRQKLAKHANYKWLLFLDADVMPKNETFLSQYMALITEPYEVIFGGFAYNKQDLKLSKSLRYIFGSKREEVDAKIRNKNPYKVIVSANFLILKSTFFNKTPLNNQNVYGLDYLFGALLKQHNIATLHVDNEVYHLGIDSNLDFLTKTKKAIQTLSKLYESKSIKTNAISLLKVYTIIKYLFLNRVLSKLFDVFKIHLERNLLGKSPKLILFDLYRLGYFCKISN